MKKGKGRVVLGVALIVGLLVGMCGTGLRTVSADPLPGRRIQLPRIDAECGWETWVQVKNLGEVKTGAIVFFWKKYSGLCPSNDPGPNYHTCMPLAAGGIWTLKGAIPQEAKSAIVYSVTYTEYATACDEAGEAVGSPSGWREWEDKYGGTGEDLAVVVDRKGPNEFGTLVASEYTGISEGMEGDKVGPSYAYFTPYVMRGYHNLDTIIYIQNSGKECVSVEITYRNLESSLGLYFRKVEQLAPGETFATTVPAELGCGFLGSATIESGEPLGIIIDQTSLPMPCGSIDRKMLLTSRGHPYEADGDRVVYATLLFRELSGWQTGVQVHNMGGVSTFVTVQFLDASGDEITYLAAWVPAHTANAFFLPMVIDLGFNYFGAAEIRSHRQINFPGEGTTDGQPIFVVVDLKHLSTGQGGSYNAHPLSQIEGVETFVLPQVSKEHQGVTSLIAVRNNSNCNKLLLELEFETESGSVICISEFEVRPGHVKLIDLEHQGCPPRGWTGGARVDVIGGELICPHELPVISGVVVNKGTYGGDLTRIYEWIPCLFCPPKVPEPTPTPTPTPTLTPTPTPTPCIDP